MSRQKSRSVATSVKGDYQVQYWKAERELNRAFIFFDHANVFHCLQELKVRIDYEAVKRRLARGYHLVAPIIYLGRPRVVYPKKQKFFSALEKTGWSIIQKPLQIDQTTGRPSQNGVDEAMFQNICDFAREGAYEKAIIVSGDNIFVSVVKELKKLDVEVDVWSFRMSFSRALIWEVGKEHAFYLDDVIGEIKL